MFLVDAMEIQIIRRRSVPLQIKATQEDENTFRLPSYPSDQGGLKEIIFATTCPSDTKATDAAIEVERELRAEGHDLKIALYSWSDLELKIAQHPRAYAFFFPSAVATLAVQSATELHPDAQFRQL